MNILFTGASSFSGMWFVRELALAGHRVTAIFQQPLEAYHGIRRQRIEKILPYCHPVFSTSFGDQDFLNLINAHGWEMLCHHAADVAHYRSPDFNFVKALENNTKNLKQVLTALQGQGCVKILLTGSVFEQNEGVGSSDFRAFSPYGLSKGLTFETFAFYAALLQLKLAKFVIPNPFGPFEEGRFTTYLAQTWLAGKKAEVRTPLYIRDNVPVALLAKSYAAFAGKIAPQEGQEKFSPSCYAESQEAFTQRFSREMQVRFRLPCAYESTPQKELTEPLVRVNSDPMDWEALGLRESQFWDELAAFYQNL